MENLSKTFWIIFGNFVLYWTDWLLVSGPPDIFTVIHDSDSGQKRSLTGQFFASSPVYPSSPRQQPSFVVRTLSSLSSLSSLTTLGLWWRCSCVSVVELGVMWSTISEAVRTDSAGQFSPLCNVIRFGPPVATAHFQKTDDSFVDGVLALTNGVSWWWQF